MVLTLGVTILTNVYETPGITIPDGLELKPGMHNDIHDIEYDIFASIHNQYPEVAQNYNIPEFRAKVANLSAQSSELGVEGISEPLQLLHVEASNILQKLFDDHGASYIEQFFH